MRHDIYRLPPLLWELGSRRPQIRWSNWAYSDQFKVFTPSYYVINWNSEKTTLKWETIRCTEDNYTCFSLETNAALSLAQMWQLTTLITDGMFEVKVRSVWPQKTFELHSVIIVGSHQFCRSSWELCRLMCPWSENRIRALGFQNEVFHISV